jgi:hypothetical protein
MFVSDSRPISGRPSLFSM